MLDEGSRKVLSKLQSQPFLIYLGHSSFSHLTERYFNYLTQRGTVLHCLRGKGVFYSLWGEGNNTKEYIQDNTLGNKRRDEVESVRCEIFPETSLLCMKKTLNFEMNCTSNSAEITRVEFDVNLTCDKCASSVKNVLSANSGIKSIDIDVEKQSVIVETSLPSQAVKEAIESTGKRAVLKGFGISSLGSAVAELKSEQGIFGVIRFHQKQENICVIDGTIDGLSTGQHGLHIHEFGDLSEGCSSIGLHFNPDNSEHGGPSDEKRHYGDLGNITADTSGRASFIVEDNIIKVWDIIGRSIAVTYGKDDLGRGNNRASKICGNSGNILTCAIIARSSGLFQNPKRICQCDGISVWDERSVPAPSL